jgi:hypothetical protein
VDVKLLRQLSQCSIALDGGKNTTFALKAGVWFPRGRLFMVSPDSQGTACPLSGRNSTYRPVQISGIGSYRASSVLNVYGLAHRGQSNVDNLSRLRACSDQRRRRLGGPNFLRWKKDNANDVFAREERAMTEAKNIVDDDAVLATFCISGRTSLRRR